jgi:hypothetical protein
MRQSPARPATALYLKAQGVRPDTVPREPIKAAPYDSTRIATSVSACPHRSSRTKLRPLRLAWPTCSYPTFASNMPLPELAHPLTHIRKPLHAAVSALKCCPRRSRICQMITTKFQVLSACALRFARALADDCFCLGGFT